MDFHEFLKTIHLTRGLNKRASVDEDSSEPEK